MTEFKINDDITVECWTYETRYSWGHKGHIVFKDGSTSKEYKITYYNRTWEEYQYQSMVRYIADRALNNKEITKEQAEEIRKAAASRL